MYDRGPAGYFGDYLGEIDRFCTEFSGSHPDQCREVQDDACRLVRSLPDAIKNEIELRDLKWKHPWLDIRT